MVEDRINGLALMQIHPEIEPDIADVINKFCASGWCTSFGLLIDPAMLCIPVSFFFQHGLTVTFIHAGQPGKNNLCCVISCK